MEIKVFFDFLSLIAGNSARNFQLAFISFTFGNQKAAERGHSFRKFDSGVCV